jgi:hypothetical protein
MIKIKSVTGRTSLENGISSEDYYEIQYGKLCIIIDCEPVEGGIRVYNQHGRTLLSVDLELWTGEQPA